MNAMEREWDHAYEKARDVRAEQAVLGGCFAKPAMLDWLQLEPEAFWDVRHQHIWAAMQTLAAARTPVDELTVAGELRIRERLAAVGGELYLGELGLRVPTVENVVAYAETLRSHLVTRRVLRLFASLPGRISDGEAGEELLGDVLVGLAAIELPPAEEEADAASAVKRELVATVTGIERRERGQPDMASIPTGIGLIDARMSGFPIGVPSVLGARPKVGKSSFALCLALSAARRGIPVQIVTLEDKRPAWAQRMLAQESGIAVCQIAGRTLAHPETARLVAAAQSLSEFRHLRIDHGHGMPIDRIARMIRARRRDLGTRFVILDYLQLLPPQSHEKRSRRDEQLEAAMNAIADLAGADDLAFLVVSQLNRAGEDEGRAPRLSDFRGSGSIEQVGKLVLALHPAQLENEINLLILANHQGPSAKLILRHDRARCFIG